MITYKCKNCGGEMTYRGSGGLVCPYCGSKSFFSDKDFKGNEEFRKKLLQFYKAQAEKKDFDYDADLLWSPAGSDSFRTEDGQDLQIEYMRKYEADGYVCYLARESVVYVFHHRREAAAFSAGVGRMVFPAADDRLHRSFPAPRMELELEKGAQALVYRRRPNCYPAEMFAPWPSEHLAWVISRMENICCALAFAGLEHGGIGPDSVWINPLLHEGVLFGDWRKVRGLRGRGDLLALRKTAIQLAKNTREPPELYRFLNSAPAADAYADFAAWDRVIEEGFGGHRFIKLNV